MDWLNRIREVLEIPLLKFGETRITLWPVLYSLVLIVLLLYITGKTRSWLVDRVLVRADLDIGVRQAAGSIFRYFVIVIGFLIILQTAGIDLTTLNILAGAIGIGVGLGLQSVANNFISGLIILFERPIKIGDRIEVGNVSGDVVAINARSTTIITNDNIAIIVPNSKFTAENVVNWSHADRRIRFGIPVSVAYESDVRLVEKLLLDVAAENPDVLEKPAPGVRFLAFGDYGLQFELRAWTMKLLHRKGRLTSDLNFAIFDKFKANGIVIPYPQREIRIRGNESALQPHFNPESQRERDDIKVGE